MASCYAFSVTLDRLKASNAFNFFRFIFRDNQHWFYDFLWFLIAARSVGGCVFTCGFNATLYNRLSVSPIFCYRAYTHARTPCVLTVFHSTRKHYAIRFFNVIFNHESLVKQISHNQLKWLIAIQNEIDNKYSLRFFFASPSVIPMLVSWMPLFRFRLSFVVWLFFFQYYLLTGDAAMSNVFSCSIKRREKTDWKVKPTWCKQYEKKPYTKFIKDRKKWEKNWYKKNKSKIDENGR